MKHPDFTPLSRVDDYMFLLNHVVEIDSIPWLGGVPAREVRHLLFEQADTFFRRVIDPLRSKGDADGARFVDGQIVSPKGFKDAYRQIVESGWHACTIPEDEGGNGLSPLVGRFAEELSAGTNAALHMYYGFAAPAVQTIRRFSEPWLADLINPRLVSGDWLATMCLTEPQAGSDLAQVRTRARLNPDGTYSIVGNKIFISAGDHDLCDNIIHIVLARTENQGEVQPGLGGLNVFVVPKKHITEGNPNHIEVIGLEHKMGLHGNPTCALRFEGAVGHLLSAGGQGQAAGMAPLFAMMNHARLSTGNGALGTAAVAIEQTHSYATKRRSGRTVGSVGDGNTEPALLIAQPDVARMILSAWSFVEGARATIIWATLIEEDGKSHPDIEIRRESTAISELLTPVLKAFLTDQAYLACDDCLQVHGGHGYIRDTGIEQFTRDLRVSRIYEGANGIQAADLMRRIVSNKGLAMAAIATQIDAFIAHNQADPDLATIIPPLVDAFQALNRACGIISAYRDDDPAFALECSSGFLKLFGLVIVGWRSAFSATRAKNADPSKFEHKRRLAEHWATRHLPKAEGLLSAMKWTSRSFHPAMIEPNSSS